MTSTGSGSCCSLLASLCQFHLFLILSGFNRARIMFGISDLLLTIPSTRNNWFLVYGAKIMVNIAGLSLTNPSFRNYFFLQPNFFNKARVLLGVAGLRLTISSDRNYLCLLCLKLDKDHTGCNLRPYDYSIHQESSLSPLCCLKSARIT